MRGGRVVVPGLGNKLVFFMPRLLPRGLMLSLILASQAGRAKARAEKPARCRPEVSARVLACAEISSRRRSQLRSRVALQHTHPLRQAASARRAWHVSRPTGGLIRTEAPSHSILARTSAVPRSPRSI
jgi:hypothetical protein